MNNVCYIKHDTFFDMIYLVGLLYLFVFCIQFAKLFMNISFEIGISVTENPNDLP